MKRAHTIAKEPSEAIAQIARELVHHQEDTVVLFISSLYDQGAIEAAIAAHFNCSVHGCTTAGEIGALGYTSHGISAVLFPRTICEITAVIIPQLSLCSRSEVEQSLTKSKELVRKRAAGWFSQNCANILLIDGLSLREEILLTILTESFPQLPLVGGSAGDDANFKQTYILYNGTFISDAAVLLTVASKRRMYCFKSQHFVPTERKAKITQSDPATRTVHQLNGITAASYYGQVTGSSLDQLNSHVFSQNPLMVGTSDRAFVVSIRQSNPDGSLSLYSAIENGTIVRFGKSVDFLENLKDTFNEIADCVGVPEMILSFECILRRIEVFDSGIAAIAGEMFAKHLCSGFHTYGEQYRSSHANQTYTGIAFSKNV